MKISCECFEDSYIADLIIANGGPGHCDILNKDSKHIYDTKTDSYLEPIFVEVLEEFVPLPSIYIKDPHLK